MWEKGDFTAIAALMRQSGDAVAKSLVVAPPPPGGIISPMTWGVDSHVIERFGQAGVAAEKISMVKDVFRFTSPDKGPADLIDLFRRFYGPTMNAFDAAQKSGSESELQRQLVELAMAQNKAADGGTSISATFLRVTVQL